MLRYTLLNLHHFRGEYIRYDLNKATVPEVGMSLIMHLPDTVVNRVQVVDVE